MVPWNSVSGGFAYIWQSKWLGIIAINTERTQIHFFNNVLVAFASLDLKVPNSRPARLQERSQNWLRAHFGSSSPPVYKECKLNVRVALFAGGTPYPTIANQRLFQVLTSGYRLEKPPMCTEETWEFFFALFDIETILIRQCEQKNTLSCMRRVKPFKHAKIKMQILNFCTCTFPIEVVGRINSINLVRSCL